MENKIVTEIKRRPELMLKLLELTTLRLSMREDKFRELWEETKILVQGRISADMIADMEKYLCSSFLTLAIAPANKQEVTK